MSVTKPGSFRVVACAGMTDGIDDGEVVEVIDPGASHAALSRKIRGLAAADRGVPYAVDYFDPSRLIWGRLLAVSYEASWTVNIETGEIDRNVKPIGTGDRSADAVIANEREHFERARKKRESAAKSAATRAKIKTKNDPMNH